MNLLKVMKDGRLEGIKVNLKQAQGLHQAIEELFETEWNQGTLSIVGEFTKYKTQLKRSYKMLDEAVRFTSIDKTMMDVLRDGAWQNYIVAGNVTKERIIQAMYNDVIGGARFSDLVNQVTGALRGKMPGVTGTPLVNYGRLHARDGIMNFMREVHVKKSQDIGIDRFLYVGDVIATTRTFCKRRAGKTYTLAQINSWTYKWAGKSGPAITHCGGWNCRHHWRGIRPEWIQDEEKLNI
jgi:hypothetical protein